MVVAVIRLEFALHDNFSLKEKRRILRRVTEKIRNRFKVSIAEVDYQDVHQAAALGVALIGSDRRVLNSVADRLTAFAETVGDAVLTDAACEIFNY